MTGRIGLSLVALIISASTAYAHPGRTDSCYGHNVRTEWVYIDANNFPSVPGEYHFHRFPYPKDEQREHILDPGPNGELRLDCIKKDGTRVVGTTRFRIKP